MRMYAVYCSSGHSHPKNCSTYRPYQRLTPECVLWCAHAHRTGHRAPSGVGWSCPRCHAVPLHALFCVGQMLVLAWTVDQQGRQLMAGGALPGHLAGALSRPSLLLMVGPAKRGSSPWCGTCFAPQGRNQTAFDQVRLKLSDVLLLTPDCWC